MQVIVVKSIFYFNFTFLVYSFAGWIIEELYSKYSTGMFKKEGFLMEPLKPMYGIAMTILIFCYEILNINKVMFILLCFLVPTLVEYITGYMLKHIFCKSYWDYSDMKYNINGYISFVFSVYWFILSYIGVVYLNPRIFTIYAGYHSIINCILIVFDMIFIVDIIITLKNILCKKVKNKEKME